MGYGVSLLKIGNIDKFDLIPFEVCFLLNLSLAETANRAEIEQRQDATFFFK
jgi:hypothetical protein